MNDTNESGSPRTPKRFGGKKVAIGFSLFLIGLFSILVVLFWSNRQPRGDVHGLIALSRDEVILMREGFEERGYLHLVREHASGGQAWSEALFGTEDDAALSLAGDTILVRAREARGHAEVHAFGTDGALRWRGGRAAQEAPDGNPVFADHPLYISEGGVVFVPHATAPIEVVGIALDGGEERFRAEIPAESLPEQRALALDGESLIVQAGESHFQISSSGEVTSAQAMRGESFADTVAQAGVTLRESVLYVVHEGASYTLTGETPIEFFAVVDNVIWCSSAEKLARWDLAQRGQRSGDLRLTDSGSTTD